MRGRRHRSPARLLSVAVLLAALVAVVGLAAAAVRDGDGGGGDVSGAGSAPAAATRPRIRVASLAAVHRGASATVRYRLGDDTGGTVSVRLVVASSDGTVVKSLRLGERRTDSDHRASFIVRSRPGDYTVTVTAGAGASAVHDQARLRVLAPLPRLMPEAASIERAIEYLKARSSDTAFAVVDTRGVLHGVDANEQFASASVVKAMLMVQYLRTHDTPSEDARETLTLMITESDNASAYAIYQGVGAAGLRNLATVAGMKRFEVGEDVLSSRITAADQARFFWSMDDYLPASQRAFAHSLLSHVSTSQAWGVADIARPEWQVFFKSGWLDEEGQDNRLVNQVARLERGKLTWSVAVLSDENPTSVYAFETLRGVTAILLGE